MENKTKPRIVVTSKRAKEHVVKARALMDEMNQGIMIQNKLREGERTRKEETGREEDRFNASNKHEQSMQREKLLMAKVSL